MLASILCVGNSIPLRINLVNKLVQRTRFSNIQYSPELQTVFKSLQTNIVEIPPSSYINKNMNSKQLPIVFSKYEISSSFLVNYWGIFWFLVIGLMSFTIITIIMIIRKKEEEDKKLKFLSFAAFNFFLVVLFGSLDDIMFFGILDMRSSSHNSALSNFSFTLALIFTISAVTLLALYFKFLRRYQAKLNGMKIAPITIPNASDLKKDNEYLKLFYQDFDDSSLTKLAFFIFFVIRSMITGVIYATLFEHPLAQSILLMLMSMTMMIALHIKRPFKEKNNHYFQLFLESVLLLVYFFDFILAIMDQAGSGDYRARERICMGIIVLAVILIVVNVIALLVKIFQALSSYFTILKFEQIYKSVKIHSEPTSPTDISRKPTIVPDQI